MPNAEIANSTGRSLFRTEGLTAAVLVNRQPSIEGAHHVEGVIGFLQGLDRDGGRGRGSCWGSCLLLELGHLRCLLLLRAWACCTLHILLELTHLQNTAQKREGAVEKMGFCDSQ